MSPARIAIGAALEASVELAHNYLGREHLLPGPANDLDSGAGRVLRDAGADSAGLRRSIAAGAAGFSRARQATSEARVTTLEHLISRLDGIEQRLGAAQL